MNTENNKTIAKFMELKLTTDGIQTLYYDKNNCLRALPKYHSDWNWLMQVVEKIESIDVGNFSLPILESIGLNAKFILNDGTRFLKDNSGETKIEAVYNACVNFINWHNENSAKEN